MSLPPISLPTPLPLKVPAPPVAPPEAFAFPPKTLTPMFRTSSSISHPNILFIPLSLPSTRLFPFSANRVSYLIPNSLSSRRRSRVAVCCVEMTEGSNWERELVWFVNSFWAACNLEPPFFEAFWVLSSADSYSLTCFEALSCKPGRREREGRREGRERRGVSNSLARVSERLFDAEAVYRLNE